MNKARERFGNLYLVGVLFLEVAVFASMIFNSRRISEMFYFLMIGIVFIIPCLKEMANKPTYNNFKTVREGENPNITKSTNKDFKASDKGVIDLKEHKKKTCTTEHYKEFNNLLTSSIKSGLMNRDCILKLKHEIRHLLGTHVEIYVGGNSKFKFENDMHEIYVLSKSSILKEGDYIYLINFLGNNLDLSSAKEV